MLIEGNGSNNTLVGTAEADPIRGFGGDDTIDAKNTTGGAIETLDGGDGIDTLIVDATAETQAVSLQVAGSPRYFVRSTSNNFVLDAFGVEKVKFTGGSANDFIDTANGGVTVDGQGGIDHWLADLGALTTAVTFALGATTSIGAAGLTSILNVEKLTLTTGTGNDTITGGSQTDSISTGVGDDTLDARTTAGGAIEFLNGGLGIDTLIVDATAETLPVQLQVAGSPRYFVRSTSNNFVLDAFGVEKVKFTGGGGADFINTGDGGLTVDGKGGIDHWQADLSALTTAVTFALGATTSIGAAGLTSILNVEKLTLTTGTGNDTITGGSQTDSISTGVGDDTLDARTTAGGAIEFLSGGEGIDTLIIDATAETLPVQLQVAGSPRYFVRSTSNNFVLDAFGVEKVKFTGGGGADFINTGDGGLTVDGKGGIDHWQADLSALTTAVTFALGATTSIGAAGLTSILNVEKLTLTTGTGNDTITGGSQTDSISTGVGDDTLDARTTAGGAIEFLSGGEGIDTLIIDATAETLPVQLQVAGSPRYFVRSTSNNFVLDAFGVEKVKFTGGGGADFINTGDGGLTVDGKGGIDHWQADLSALTTAVAFTLGTTTAIVAAGLTSITNIEKLTLTTGTGNDTITGGAQTDSINTGPGDDTLNAQTTAGGAIEFLNGGDGIDTLIVDASAETQPVQLQVAGSPRYFVRSNSNNFVLDAFNVEKVRFTGGSGSDTINTDTGGVTVNGGAGIDHWIANLAGVATAISFSLGTTAAIAAAGLSSILNLEKISLSTGAGNDTIAGGAQADAINTGAGDDTLDAKTTAGSVIEFLDGGLGIDTLIVDASTETQAVSLQIAGSPRYFVRSTSNNFRFDAFNVEKVRFTGGSGADTINTDTGGVTVNGGAGVDHWIANLAGVATAITFALGTTAAIAAAGLTSITSVEKISLTTGAGGDTITGGGQADFISTGAGNDSIDAKTTVAGAADTVSGGAGVDTLIVDASAETQAVQLFAGGAPSFSLRSTSGKFNLDAFAIEKVRFTGGAANDSAAGNDGDDILNTGAGNDTVNGGGGADSVAGGAGNDSLQGGVGNDTLQGGTGNDTMDGGAGVDAMAGGAGNDSYRVDNAGDSTEDAAGGGVDKAFVTVNYVLAAGREIEELVADYAGPAGIALYGNEFNTLFRGGGAGDSILGYGGNDTLQGGGGADLLFGGSFAADGSVAPGSGNDTIFGEDGADSLWGFDGNDSITGGAANDVILAGTGDDTADGGEGDDIVLGSDFGPGGVLPNSGADSLRGGNGNDGVWGYDGNDTLGGDAGGDYIEGGGGNDSVNGGADGDTLLGQDGNDLIGGGSGFDYIYGGAGADTFNFRKFDSYDNVFDFSAAQGDKLRLDPAFGVSTFAAFQAKLTGFFFDGSDYTVIGFAESIDQLTLKGISHTAWTAAMVEFA